MVVPASMTLQVLPKTLSTALAETTVVAVWLLATYGLINPIASKRINDTLAVRCGQALGHPAGRRAAPAATAADALAVTPVLSLRPAKV